jgi:hypothetical protein
MLRPIGCTITLWHSLMVAGVARMQLDTLCLLSVHFALCEYSRLGLAVPVACSRCGGRRFAVLAGVPMGLVRLPMGLVRLPMGCGLPLAVLLSLLDTVLLGEVGDTVPNPMHSFAQRVLAALHLGLYLLAEHPTGSGRRCTAADGAHRDDRRQDCHRCFAFDRCRKCGGYSGCHTHPRFISSHLLHGQGAGVGALPVLVT